MISGRIESGMRDPDDGIPNCHRFSTSGNAEHILLTLDYVSFTTRQCHETEKSTLEIHPGPVFHPSHLSVFSFKRAALRAT